MAENVAWIGRIVVEQIDTNSNDAILAEPGDSVTNQVGLSRYRTEHNE